MASTGATGAGGQAGQIKYTLAQTMKKIGGPMVATSAPQAAVLHRQAAWARTSAVPAEGFDYMGYVPSVERFWVKAPPSPLNTVATRREWFRLMQMNVMADTVSVHARLPRFGDPPGDHGFTHFSTAPVTEVDVRLPVPQSPADHGSKAETGAETDANTEPHARYDAMEPPAASHARAASAEAVAAPSPSTAAGASDRPSGSHNGGHNGSHNGGHNGARGGHILARSELPLCLSNVDPSQHAADAADWLLWEQRMRYVLGELQYYDPDVACINEIGRLHVGGAFSRAIRAHGYGALYTSARKGAHKMVLRLGEDPAKPQFSHKTQPENDIGNAIVYHKGRFFPYLMPGFELPRNLHFVNLCGLRDKVTNMQLLIGCVQLTAGIGKAAVKRREYEARQILHVLEPHLRLTSEKFHQSMFLTGDLNNEDESEPCVGLLRDKFASAYDMVGGPRWTAWHRRLPPAPCSWELPPAVAPAATSTSAAPAAPPAAEASTKQAATADVDAATGEADATGGASPVEALAVRTDGSLTDAETIEGQRSVMLAQNIVKRCSDFMFFDPSRLSLLQVLDIPSDALIDQTTLLPCRRHPFHHVHLVADYCWNDWAPEVGGPLDTPRVGA